MIAIEDADPADLLTEYTNVAVIKGRGAGTPFHIVDTTTFDNHWPAPNDYAGTTANIGEATARCGHTPFGTMVPADGNVTRANRLCGNCLRSLQSSKPTDKSNQS